jgi:2-polyprenyl-3-methyl-5-hydroxy-6-metoxy-1,4-benzoquinol methylase
MTYLQEPGICMSASYNQLILKHFYKKAKTHFLTPSILDAGSGLGFNLPTIFDIWPKANVVALDVCKEALEVSKLCFNREETISNTYLLIEEYGLEDWVITDILESRQISFPGKRVNITVNDIINYQKSNKQRFDIVIGTEVLQFAADPEETLTSLCSLVDKKGYLILSFPNYYRHTTALVKKHQDKKTGNPGWSPWGERKNEKENTVNWLTIEKLINKLNFSIIDRKAANYFLAWIPFIAKRLKRKKVHNLGVSCPMIRLGDLVPYVRRFAMNYFILAAPK